MYFLSLFSLEMYILSPSPYYIIIRNSTRVETSNRLVNCCEIDENLSIEGPTSNYT